MVKYLVEYSQSFSRTRIKGTCTREMLIRLLQKGYAVWSAVWVNTDLDDVSMYPEISV